MGAGEDTWGPLNCDQRKDVKVPFALVLMRISNENGFQGDGFREKLTLWIEGYIYILFS